MSTGVVSDPQVAPGEQDAARWSGTWRHRSAATALAGVAAGVVFSQLVIARSPVPPWTSVLILVLAVAVLGQVWGSPGSVVRRGAAAVAVVGGVGGAFFALQFLLGIGSEATGRPSPYAAIAACLVAGGVAVLDRRSPTSVLVGATALLTAGFIPLVALLRGAYGDPGTVDPVADTSIPFESALLLLAVVMAAALARPRRLPLGAVTESGAMPLAVAAVLGLVVSTVATRSLADRWSLLHDPRAATTAEVLLQIVVIGLILATAIVVASTQQRRQAQRVAEDAAQRAYRQVMSGSAVGFAVLDPFGRVTAANASFVELVGASDGGVVGTAWQDLMGRSGAVEANGPAQRVRILRDDGSVAWGDVVATRGHAGGSTLLQVVDRTDEHRAETQLRWAAEHDAVTGVLSRPEVLSRLEGVASEWGPGARCVLVTDLDGFRVVNEAFSGSAGDAVLREVAGQLQDAVGERASVGRLYSDVFLVVGAAGSGTAAAEHAEAAGQVLGADRRVVGQRIRLSACVGATATRPGADADDLVQEAMAALATAKRAGPGRTAVYTEEMRGRAREAVHLRDGLMRLRDLGDRAHELEFWFQPIVDLRTTDTVGYEALARWRHPQRGLIAAGQFLEAAEDDPSLIQWIGERALDAAGAFASSLDPELRVTVNLSGTQVSAPDLLGSFVDRAVAVAPRPGALAAEITETVLSRVSPEAAGHLTRMVRAGVPLYVDDFGAGFSSVAHLRDLPVGALKLDRAYTSAALGGEGPLRLAEGIASLAEGMGLHTVAEGIETVEHARVMRAAGWRAGQGWYLGHPAPADHWLPAPA
ncbi:MAG: EAL domain-containing protein [Candidatus Nanopelagicales bacterium]